jgi:hypothetical protein
MSNSRPWLVLLGVIIVIGLIVVGMVYTVQQAALRALEPVQDLSGDVGTQVANVLNPTPTVLPDPITVIHDVRSLARLETIQFSIEKVITAESGQGALSFLFGDRLLFIAHGDVIAGVDLAKLRPEDLWVEDQVLYVRLPAPEIFVSALDNDKSYVYDRETGVLTKGDINLETSARRVAEQAIESAAAEDGILDMARLNAENFMSRLLRDLGYPDVVFVPPEPLGTPTPITP